MRISQVLAITGSGLVSCGFSQVFGFTALGVTATLTIWNLAHRAIFESKLKQLGQSTAFYDFYKDKITKCNSNLQDYKKYAKVFGFCLIPMAGVYLAGKYYPNLSVQWATDAGRVNNFGKRAGGLAGLAAMR